MSFITSPGVIVPPLTAGGVAYGTGGQAKMNSAGTAGQALLSAGAGVPTWGNAAGSVVPPFTAGAVAYGTGTDVKLNAAGTAGQVLTSAGAGIPVWALVTAGFTLGTPVNVSGSSVSITGIPAGAKQIVLMFKAVRSNAAVNKFIQLGDSSGFVTTGYVAQEAYITGSPAVDSFTDAWRVRGDAASYTTISGAMTFTRYDGSAFTYVGAGTFSYPEINKATTLVSGFVTLNSVLTQIRVTVSGTTFDTGSINIAYI